MRQSAHVRSTSGIAVLFGRIGFGLLLDRVHAPLVGVLALVLSAAAAVIYATIGIPAIVLIGAIIGGLSIGGETDLMPYLASRISGYGPSRKLSGVRNFRRLCLTGHVCSCFLHAEKRL